MTAMYQLLWHLERELSFIRDEADDFARRFPRIAARLSIGSDVLRDPHVERFIQAFATMSARMHKRLDDDFPLFTEALLNFFYPHYLRPLPACSIAHFDLGAVAKQMHEGKIIPRNVVLKARPIRNVECRFTTTAGAQLLPLRVASAGFCAGAAVPSSTPLPGHAIGLLSLCFELASSVLQWHDLGVDRIRLYIDGDPGLVTLLRETLVSKVASTLVQTSTSGTWHAEPSLRPLPVGLDDDEALVHTDARSCQAHRLLAEYFAFPEKFNFIDVPLPDLPQHMDTRVLSLHFAISGMNIDSDEVRLLKLVSAANFLTGCAPVINLFSQHAEPVTVTHRSATYPVLPDQSTIAFHEVYAIDRVFRAHRTTKGTSIQQVPPLYRLCHEDLLRNAEGPPPYWYACRSDGVSAKSPGYETAIGLVDLGFDPSEPGSETLSIEVRTTNRDFPCRMSIGNADGDLVLFGSDNVMHGIDRGTDADSIGHSWESIRLLRRPSSPLRFDVVKEGLWRLMSHLSLAQLSLSAVDIDTLKELLRLYDLSRSTHAERLMEGLVSVEYRSIQACVAGNPYATVVRGTEVRLTVNEHYFVGSGLFLFAQVMERIFGLYAQLNSFTQLRLLSSRTGEVLFSGARRSSDISLL